MFRQNRKTVLPFADIGGKSAVFGKWRGNCTFLMLSGVFYRIFRVDSRTFNSTGRRICCFNTVLLLICRINTSAASFPISADGSRTVVRAGEKFLERAISLKPTTPISCGQFKPKSFNTTLRVLKIY